jgi:hypothetical protein
MPPAPRGQGEIDGSAHPAQADFNIRRGGYEHPSSAHTNGLYCIDKSVSSIDSTIDTSIEKHASFSEKVGHGGNKHVSFLDNAKETRTGGGKGSRTGGGNGIGKEADRSGGKGD